MSTKSTNVKVTHSHLFQAEGQKAVMDNCILHLINSMRSTSSSSTWHGISSDMSPPNPARSSVHDGDAVLDLKQRHAVSSTASQAIIPAAFMLTATLCWCAGSAAKKAGKRSISFRQRADSSDREDAGSSDQDQAEAEDAQGTADAIEEDAEPAAPSSSQPPE